MENDTMTNHYEWYYRCQIECLQPIRIGYGDIERIKKILIIPVIEDRPVEPKTPEEDDE